MFESLVRFPRFLSALTLVAISGLMLLSITKPTSADQVGDPSISPNRQPVAVAMNQPSTRITDFSGDTASIEYVELGKRILLVRDNSWAKDPSIDADAVILPTGHLLVKSLGQWKSYRVSNGPQSQAGLVDSSLAVEYSAPPGLEENGTSIVPLVLLIDPIDARGTRPGDVLTRTSSSTVSVSAIGANTSTSTWNLILMADGHPPVVVFRGSRPPTEAFDLEAMPIFLPL